MGVGAAAGGLVARRALLIALGFVGGLAGVETGAFFLTGRRALCLCSLSALLTSLASLRMRLASFLACLKALRASLNLALANRANLRAVSACFSACAARVARAAALSFVLRRVALEVLLFIVLLLIRRDRPWRHQLSKPAR